MSRRSSPFPRKPASRRPYKPDPGAKSPRPSYPALDFAKTFDMLTDEEIEACEEDQAEIQNRWLIYKHRRHGRSVQLYPGRRLDLLTDQLLGLNQEEGDA